MKYLGIIFGLLFIFMFGFNRKVAPYLKLANYKVYYNPYEKIILGKYEIIDELDGTVCGTGKVIDIGINNKIYGKQYIFFPNKSNKYKTYNEWYNYIDGNKCLNYLKNIYGNHFKYYKISSKGIKIDRIIIGKYIFKN